MISHKRSSSVAVIGGKTARACDSCLLKRARWYCAADDAFLCQGCNSSVHSANQLASRHERVRLATASSSAFKGAVQATAVEDSVPAWHRGFTKKARTPRHNNNNKQLVSLQSQNNYDHKKDESFMSISPLIVPEMGSEDVPIEESEEQILCRVPVFDPFDTDLCELSNEEEKPAVGEVNDLVIGFQELDSFQGFLPSDVELAEFAADVESLLRREGNNSKDSCKEKRATEARLEGLKVEEEEEIEAVLTCHYNPMLDMIRETLGWHFDYNSPVQHEEEEETKMMSMEDKKIMNDKSGRVDMERRMLLSLNYEGVIKAWDSHGCPWTNGIRPEFDLRSCWSDFMGICTTTVDELPRGIHGVGGHAVSGGDGEREARVSRYREKRRTRLFSKKIRYEVRKLNAEKRPRMKGRFVKRTSFAGAATGLS